MDGQMDADRCVSVFVSTKRQEATGRKPSVNFNQSTFDFHHLDCGEDRLAIKFSAYRTSLCLLIKRFNLVRG